MRLALRSCLLLNGFFELVLLNKFKQVQTNHSMNEQNTFKDAVETLNDANKHVSMMKQHGTWEAYKTALEFAKIAEQIVIESLDTAADTAYSAYIATTLN